MKKVYKLRKEVKYFLIGVAFVVVFTGLIIEGLDRIEKINNGELTQISESYMDR
jgi:FtsH-binding integral membrane protein